MSAVAVVGAGPGLGLAIGRKFGGEGYDVALVARGPERLDRLAAQLSAEGINARGFTADVLEPDSLSTALADAAEHFGGIEVLEYSPSTVQGALVGPRDLTVADLDLQVRYQVHGAITAARAVLPAMQAAGSGTLLFTTGTASIDPNPLLAGVGSAGAALRNWVLNLHEQLRPDGIQAAHVAIGVVIGDRDGRGPDGVPTTPADDVAPVYWDLHVHREQAERIVRD